MRRGAIKRLDVIEDALTQRTPRRATPYALFAERHPLGTELADRLAALAKNGDRTQRWQLHQAVLNDPIALEMSLDLLDAFDEQRIRNHPPDAL